MRITISISIKASIERVWAAWTSPDEIVDWNFASPDWCCPRARLDLAPGGEFSYRMEARDGSMGFDYAGRFEEVLPHERIRLALDDGRDVQVRFSAAADGTVTVEESFEADSEHSAEQQRLGWLAILENFGRHVEGAGR